MGTTDSQPKKDVLSGGVAAAAGAAGEHVSSASAAAAAAAAAGASGSATPVAELKGDPRDELFRYEPAPTVFKWAITNFPEKFSKLSMTDPEKDPLESPEFKLGRGTAVLAVAKCLRDLHNKMVGLPESDDSQLALFLRLKDAQDADDTCLDFLAFKIWSWAPTTSTVVAPADSSLTTVNVACGWNNVKEESKRYMFRTYKLIKWADVLDEKKGWLSADKTLTVGCAFAAQKTKQIKSLVKKCVTESETARRTMLCVIRPGFVRDWQPKFADIQLGINSAPGTPALFLPAHRVVLSKSPWFQKALFKPDGSPQTLVNFPEIKHMESLEHAINWLYTKSLQTPPSSWAVACELLTLALQFQLDKLVCILFKIMFRHANAAEIVHWARRIMPRADSDVGKRIRNLVYKDLKFVDALLKSVLTSTADAPAVV
jgi:hypothetical protein